MLAFILKEAGFPEENIALVGGQYVYEYDGVYESALHVAVCARIGKDQYILDLNFDSPVILTDDYTTFGPAAYDEFEGLEGKNIAVSIDDVMLFAPIAPKTDVMINLSVLNTGSQASSSAEYENTNTPGMSPAGME